MKQHGNKGRIPPTKGKGKPAAWLFEHADHAGLNCLQWPFPFSKLTGYPQFGYRGKVTYAHRFMCELKNGPPPSPKSEAAHTCGNAHMQCVNPNHLKWKTKIENAQDRKRHGNYQDQVGTRRWRLSPEQVDTIKDLKGKVSQYVLAKEYGVSRQTISGIHTGVLYTSNKAALVWRKRNQGVLI